MSIRAKLIAFCQASIEERILTAQNAVKEARTSSAGETKSSAGDKYETTREMLQGVIEQHTHQLMEAKKIKETLQMIVDGETSPGKVGAGSVVLSSGGNFFLSVPGGFTEIDGAKYALISLSSPIGKLLVGKSKGDCVSFNGRDYKISQVIP